MKHFALAKEEDEVEVIRREPITELLGGGFETVFQTEFVFGRADNQIEQGFARVGETSEGCEQDFFIRIL